MSYNDNNDNFDDDRGFLQRYGFVFGIGGVILVAVIIFAGRQLFSGHSSAQRKNQEIVMIKLPPTPPPPPPVQKPPEPVMKKDEMVMQDKVDKDEQKPDEQPKAAPITTGIKGNGPDSFGLSGGNGNGMIGGGKHNGGKWGWYAAQVQTRIEDAMRSNAKTRSAKLSIVVRIWVDPNTGRVTRAEVSSGVADPALESAITNEVLNGLQLQEPPPDKMPMPINLRLTEQRPN